MANFNKISITLKPQNMYRFAYNKNTSTNIKR